MKNRFRVLVCSVLVAAMLCLLPGCGGGGGGTPAPDIKISNTSLLSVLGNNSPDYNFPGIGSFIDSKVAFNTADMFLNLPFDTVTKALVTENCNRFLKIPVAPPAVLYQGSSLPNNVVVNALANTITASLSESSGGVTVATTTVTWSFTGTGVQRLYVKRYTAGSLNNSVYQSSVSYTYTGVNGIIHAIFSEAADQTRLVASGNAQTVKARYSGTVDFTRSTDDGSLLTLTNATISQTHTEFDPDSGYSQTLNGSLVLQGILAQSGSFTFNGNFSFGLPLYNTVAGSVSMTGGKFGNGINNLEYMYFNEIDVSTAVMVFLSKTDYSSVLPAINPAAFQGAWVGAFTDSCSTGNPGKLELSITDALASWFGQSDDKTRNYGVSAVVDGSVLRIRNDASPWGISTSVSDTLISGNWSSGGCGGTFSVQKK